MNSKSALLIVFSIVLTGEAIAEFFAKNQTYVSAALIVGFSILLIRSIKASSKNRREGGPFL